MSEDVIHRLVDLEDHFEYTKGGKKAKDHPQLFDKFAKEHFWRPTFWALGDEERARYEAQKRPTEDSSLVVVEIEDVIRVTLPARLDTLGVNARIEDLESTFLFHCKGFGTPSGQSDMPAECCTQQRCWSSRCTSVAAESGPHFELQRNARRPARPSSPAGHGVRDVRCDTPSLGHKAKYVGQAENVDLQQDATYRAPRSAGPRPDPEL